MYRGNTKWIDIVTLQGHIFVEVNSYHICVLTMLNDSKYNDREKQKWFRLKINTKYDLNKYCFVEANVFALYWLLILLQIKTCVYIWHYQHNKLSIYSQPISIFSWILVTLHKIKVITKDLAALSFFAGHTKYKERCVHICFSCYSTKSENKNCNKVRPNFKWDHTTFLCHSRIKQWKP